MYTHKHLSVLYAGIHIQHTHTYAHAHDKLVTV